MSVIPTSLSNSVNGLNITHNLSTSSYSAIKNIIKTSASGFVISVDSTSAKDGTKYSKPCMKNIQREKNKLKKFKKKMDEGMMNYEDIKLQYIGWRQANIIYNRKKAVKNVDKLFNKLFETNLSI